MNKDISADNGHLYVFLDERAPGWGTRFLSKAAILDSNEHKTLLNSVVSYKGYDLWKDGKLSLMFPSEWMYLFRQINNDRTLLRPSLNWIAEEYLFYKGVISSRLPEGEKQKIVTLNNADNYYYVIYHVDTVNKCIVNKPL